MSFIKRSMDEQENKRQVAIQICLEADVLDSCDDHGVIFQGEEDVEEAYKLGNRKFTAGELGRAYSSRREMTDFIQEVASSGDHAGECCFECEERFRD
ncbi:hypothetical protein LDS54_000184 [Salmonella enterica]|uniref:Uncharacterized protein n=3 Tax=Salmonella enterica I TaxID=59201 RepID=A0A702N9E6_SALET|nr:MULTISPECIES: hypothetical protein [Salmonella]EBP3891612.1 hypothetical protein [Salmonella enterica subsp. enterica]EBU8750881.1 hypothetical protein [Salmonella enterica subsp. enterica serovar Ordonez]EBV8191949.1 hypothetical protein [Salmonella enterica subsp. enterica serovar Derby]EBW0789436.1 hypothetical protein [Salmonella enterica subsp. enterica serovar Muenster]ECS2866438.1 hypothetical protein [Salmonella enterica subsp. enterica serovar Farmsen]EDE4800412.1 hypothetical pro